MMICLFNIILPGSIPGINYTYPIILVGCERRAFLIHQFQLNAII